MSAAPSPRNRTFSIVEALGGAIVAGEYDAANPLPNEGELAQQFGVSRSILREAVKMLTSKGLVASRPRHGTWVTAEAQWNFLDPDVLNWLLGRAYSPELLIQFTELRLAIEPRAAALAAARATPESRLVSASRARFSASLSCTQESPCSLGVEIGATRHTLCVGSTSRQSAISCL